MKSQSKPKKSLGSISFAPKKPWMEPFLGLECSYKSWTEIPSSLIIVACASWTAKSKAPSCSKK
ncbi:hypothetical protein D3C72_789290 [compost metagenome]